MTVERQSRSVTVGIWLMGLHLSMTDRFGSGWINDRCEFPLPTSLHSWRKAWSQARRLVATRPILDYCSAPISALVIPGAHRPLSSDGTGYREKRHEAESAPTQSTPRLRLRRGDSHRFQHAGHEPGRKCRSRCGLPEARHADLLPGLADPDHSREIQPCRRYIGERQDPAGALSGARHHQQAHGR